MHLPMNKIAPFSFYTKGANGAVVAPTVGIVSYIIVDEAGASASSGIASTAGGNLFTIAFSPNSAGLVEGNIYSLVATWAASGVNYAETLGTFEVVVDEAIVGIPVVDIRSVQGDIAAAGGLSIFGNSYGTLGFVDANLVQVNGNPTAAGGLSSFGEQYAGGDILVNLQGSVNSVLTPVEADVVSILNDSNGLSGLTDIGEDYTNNLAVTADVFKWRGATVPVPHTSGYPVVTHKVGTGTGEINLSAGTVPVVATSVRSAVGMALANLDAQLTAILAASGGIGDMVIEPAGGVGEPEYTLTDALRLILAQTTGLTNRHTQDGELVVNFRDVNNRITRLSMKLDRFNDRTEVTKDVTDP